MNKGPRLRAEKTFELFKKFIPPNSKIYDIGHDSELADLIRSLGHEVVNNSKETDIDYDQSEVSELSAKSDITVSFEVFEHLTNLFSVLTAIKTNKLLLTVPCRVWFKSAYWGPNDFDHHYHEFEYKQLEKILNKTGWKIKEYGFWKISFGWGPLSILRKIWPSYIWIYAEK